MPIDVYQRTEYHKEINRISHLGQVPIWKGKKGAPMGNEQKDKIRNALLHHNVSIETRKKISKANTGKVSKYKGIPRSKEVRQKIGLGNRGKVQSEECKKMNSLSHKGMHSSPKTEFKKGHTAPKTAFKPDDSRISGKNNPNWKGGISPEIIKIRQSIDGDIWRKGVFSRDNYKSVKSGQGGKINAHHVLNFSSYPELRTSIENGVTLTEEEHVEFHKRFGKRNNTREQLDEFLNN